jgi:hypothetical protein
MRQTKTRGTKRHATDLDRFVTMLRGAGAEFVRWKLTRVEWDGEGQPQTEVAVAGEESPASRATESSSKRQCDEEHPHGVPPVGCDL